MRLIPIFSWFSICSSSFLSSYHPLTSFSFFPYELLLLSRVVLDPLYSWSLLEEVPYVMKTHNLSPFFLHSLSVSSRSNSTNSMSSNPYYSMAFISAWFLSTRLGFWGMNLILIASFLLHIIQDWKMVASRWPSPFVTFSLPLRGTCSRISFTLDLNEAILVCQFSLCVGSTRVVDYSFGYFCRNVDSHSIVCT